MRHPLFYHLNHRHVAAAVALLGLDIVFFNLTNPSTAPSGLLIVGFVLVALSLYVLLRLILAVASVYGVPMRERGRRPALFIGVGLAIVVALQSLGELSLRDVVVLLLLTVIAYVYTTYGRRTT